MRCLRLLIVFSFLFGPCTVLAQSGKIEDIYNRMWFIIAMKCPEDQQLNTPPDQFSNYYFTLKWEPNNPNEMDQGRYEKIYRDIIEGERETGHYVIRKQSIGEGRMVLDAGYGNKREYIIRLSDENHMVITSVTENTAERCKMFYAVAQ